MGRARLLHGEGPLGADELAGGGGGGAGGEGVHDASAKETEGGVGCWYERVGGRSGFQVLLESRIRRRDDSSFSRSALFGRFLLVSFYSLSFLNPVSA